MKKFYLLLLPVILTACGPGALPMGHADIEGKTMLFSRPGTSPTFTELTFGNSLAHAAANSLVAPAFQNHQQPINAVENSQQREVNDASPDRFVALELKKRLRELTGWKEDAANPDYEVTYGSAWGIRHHPLAVSTYHIFYNGYLSIRETKIAEGKKSSRSATFSCMYKTDSDYYYDEVFNQHAAAVQKVMEKAAPECVEQIYKQLVERVKKDSAK